MSQIRGQQNMLGLHGLLVYRIATTFPATLAAFPFQLIKQWIARKLRSILLTPLHSLGNLSPGIAATLTRWISTFKFGLSRLIRPSASPLSIPEPPPTEMMILARLMEYFDGQQFVRRVSRQASFDHDRPDVRERQSRVTTYEIYDSEYNLVFSSVEGRTPVGGGVPFRLRLPRWKTPLHLQITSEESWLRFTTDGQFIYVSSHRMILDYGDVITSNHTGGMGIGIVNCGKGINGKTSREEGLYGKG